MQYRQPPGIDRTRFPVDLWSLVETRPSAEDLGVTETLFALSNGYLGVRANPPEGRVAHSHGTFVNGLHETWPIHYPESAYGLASMGQTIVNAPDTKLMKLYVEDEPLLLDGAELAHYRRSVNFKTGLFERDLTWKTRSGHLLQVRSTRMISLRHRHLGMFTLELRLLDSDAALTVSSQIQNRQDGQDEYNVPAAALGEGTDPRQARSFAGRVLHPEHQLNEPRDGVEGGEVALGYRTATSEMTVAVAYAHEIETSCRYQVETEISVDHAATVFDIDAEAGEAISITKYVAYHSSCGVPARELARRCQRTIRRARAAGAAEARAEQAKWLAGFWEAADVEIANEPGLQQALRWNLWQLAQATACANGDGIPAKGLTGSGYDGQYFWDTEIYIAPFLAYTRPSAAKNLLRFRHDTLDAARDRAAELGHPGALFPWRTINGEEASAYYPAGTAQYHIDAAIAYAIETIHRATGDDAFLHKTGAEILIGSARLFEDLGFYSGTDRRSFHIHGVTGPDEYSAMVNDNFYTNVMARQTLRLAANLVEQANSTGETDLVELIRTTGATGDEAQRWRQAADVMHLPADDELGIYLQDAGFLDREPWDFSGTPEGKYPLLLHFHPLSIYRKQVLKQPDVVLAMVLRPHEFSTEQRIRNFAFYDRLTTGDSSLSACIQAVAAAGVGEIDKAVDYLTAAAFVDIADSHRNTADGVHLANAGGLWAAAVRGFVGFVDHGDAIEFDPQIPSSWGSVSFPLVVRRSHLTVKAAPTEVAVTLSRGDPIDVIVHGARTKVFSSHTFPVDARHREG